MADELQNNGLNVQGTTGHEDEVVTVRGSRTSFQKFKDDLIGIPNQSDAVYYTQAEADAYNAELEGALNSTDPLTAEEAAAYNAATPGATKEAGDTLSEAEANGYNATLDGAVDTSTVKTPAVPKKVKNYVDETAVTAVAFDSSSGKIKQTKNGTTTDVVQVYTKAQVDAMRSPVYNVTNKRYTFPANATFEYQSANKRIILSH